MDNYICKIATKEEKLAKLEYDKSMNPGEEENWDTWINEFKNRPEGERITYIGLLNNKIICEVSAALVSNGIANSDGLVDDKTAYLFAFRTIEEYQRKGYFSKLFKYMLNDLKDRGYEKATLGVEPAHPENKEIYFHFGFTEHIKDGIEVEPDGTQVDVEYYGKKL